MFLDRQVLVEEGRAASPSAQQEWMNRWRRSPVKLQVCICLLLACMGAGWLAAQAAQQSVQRRYVPDWGGASWIEADSDTANMSTVTYFRYKPKLAVTPKGAALVIAANQAFDLYVNGSLIGSTTLDSSPEKQSYLYDVHLSLQRGQNIIAVRVRSPTGEVPRLRLKLLPSGDQTTPIITDQHWRVTTQSAQAFPTGNQQEAAWTARTFDDRGWSTSRKIQEDSSRDRTTSVNPILYEQPFSLHWVSAGGGHEGYFIRQIQLDQVPRDAWLRLVATGNANISVNGTQLKNWSPLPGRGQTDLAVGIYHISAYLHSGVNTLALQVVPEGQGKPVPAAISTDLLLEDQQGRADWQDLAAGWRSSSQPIDGWNTGSELALLWLPAFELTQPVNLPHLYLPSSVDAQVQTPLSWQHILLAVSVTVMGVFAFWLLLGLGLLRRYCRTRWQALENASLVFLPPLAAEFLGVILSAGLPRFYGGAGIAVLSLLLILTSLLLWRETSRSDRLRQASSSLGGLVRLVAQQPTQSRPLWNQSGIKERRRTRLLRWLQFHWAALLLCLCFLELLGFQLATLPYSPEELLGYYAARGIQMSGLPHLPSGILYPRGIVASYLLALDLTIFGSQAIHLRLLVLACSILSFWLCYRIGTYFFERKTALLAALWLACSPLILLGQISLTAALAQIFTLLVLYWLFLALRPQGKPIYMYLSIGTLAVAYLSYEETFVLLPAVLTCVLLLIVRQRRLRVNDLLSRWHVWLACSLGFSLIVAYLLISRAVLPPMLGTDQSQVPLIHLVPDILPFYVSLFVSNRVADSEIEPVMTMNALLGVLGCVWGLSRRNLRVRYCALFLLVALLAISLFLLRPSLRSLYPLLPLFYFLGAYGLTESLSWLRLFAHECLGRPRIIAGQRRLWEDRRSTRVLMVCTAGAVCLAVLLAPLLPVSAYNLPLSRLFRETYQPLRPDLASAGVYVKDHWRPGDIVIAEAPSISTLYYSGHLDYVMTENQAQTLQERHSRIIDRATGAGILLNQNDLKALLNSRSHVWIVVDNSTGDPEGRQHGGFTLPPGLRPVYESTGTAVFEKS